MQGNCLECTLSTSRVTGKNFLLDTKAVGILSFLISNSITPIEHVKDVLLLGERYDTKITRDISKLFLPSDLQYFNTFQM